MVRSIQRGLLGLVVVAGALVSGGSQATVTFIGGSDAGGPAPYFQNYAFATAINGATGGFTPEMGVGTIYSSNFAPAALSVNSTFNVDGATITGTASTVASGFYAAHNAASLDITNTQAANGYYAIGAFGSRTTVEFFTAGALADRAVFHWHVSGTQSPNNIATCDFLTVFDNCVSSWLDFLATTDTNAVFVDLFDVLINPLTKFGPGDFTYDISGLPLNQTISLLYWSSAFVTVDDSQITQGGTFSAFANYSNTFTLESIDLYDADNNLLPEWSLVDVSSGQTVFDQNGALPTTFAPEPATVALLAGGVLFIGVSRRKQRA